MIVSNSRLVSVFTIIARGVLISLLVILATACGVADKNAVISAEELSSRIADGSVPVVIDVRSEEEFAGGHVPGAINIPLGTQQEQLPALDLSKGQEIILYCESGGRAGKFAEAMRAEGFYELRLLDGSMRAWRQHTLANDTAKLQD